VQWMGASGEIRGKDEKRQKKIDKRGYMHIIFSLKLPRFSNSGGAMRRTMMVATLFLLAAPALVSGANYQWLDDAGVVHFTDDSDRIPDKYLKRAREMEPVGAEKKPEATAQKPGVPAAVPAARETAAASAAADAAGSAQRARVAAELRQIRDRLVTKMKELDRLQHKWNVAKGRTPTLEEAKEFQKRLAEGKATDKDNPYINKNSALTWSAPARAAYYKKLGEVRQDQARAHQLEQELEALK